MVSTGVQSREKSRPHPGLQVPPSFSKCSSNMSRSDSKLCVEELINSVMKRPVIYSLSEADHKDQTKVNLAWREVLKDLEDIFPHEELIRAKLTTLKEIKDKFRNLR